MQQVCNTLFTAPYRKNRSQYPLLTLEIAQYSLENDQSRYRNRMSISIAIVNNGCNFSHVIVAFVCKTDMIKYRHFYPCQQWAYECYIY